MDLRKAKLQVSRSLSPEDGFCDVRMCQFASNVVCLSYRLTMRRLTNYSPMLTLPDVMLAEFVAELLTLDPE